ncbi:hypothetical protein B7P43_G03226 [Cryptotermes secundus]|uniref:Uncharacterized protein n=1 Tax=Cryptotermes secundus TaxID=105785 RepID=A0A2J7RRZ0_9NEOP|nr:hypothetical protein B7P43_G03226 [Cryptotermes secundus]
MSHCHIMDMEKILELLKEIRANQEMMEMMGVGPEEDTVDTKEETMACQEMEARLQEEKPAPVTMACQEMEAHLEGEKPASVDRKPEAAEEQEVPVKDAEVMPFGELKKKRRRDRNQQTMKNSTWENCGSQKKLAIARRGTSLHAKEERQKEKSRKVSRRATVAGLKRNIFRNTTQKNCGPHKRLEFASKGTTRHAKVETGP